MKNTLMQSAVYTFPANTLADQKDTLKGRSGVYGFINVTNGNYYIGSGVYLWFRLLDYQQPWYLKMKMHLPIIRAISKYGLDNFIIVILEFTTREEAVSAEQVYINKFNPAYNILQTAGNSLGYKHTEESKAKISSTMTGSKWTDERRTEHSQRQTGSGNTFYGKNHTDEAKALLRAHALARTTSPKPTHLVEARDIVTGITTTYSSLRKAGEALGVSHSHLRKFNGRNYKGHHITIYKS